MNIATAEKKLFSGTTHWVIQGGVFVPFTAIAPGQAITSVLYRQFPKLGAEKIAVVSTQNGLKSYWIYDEQEFEDKGYWCFRHPEYVGRVYQRWLGHKQTFYREISRLERLDITKQPLNEFRRFYQVYLREYSLPLITEYYSLGGDKFVRQLKQRYSGYSRLDSDIVIFTRTPKKSFLQRAELAQLKLALEMKGKRLPRRIDEFRKQWPKQYPALEHIQRTFFWIYFDYRNTVPLTRDYFYQKLRTSVARPPKSLRQRTRELEHYRDDTITMQLKAKRHTRLTTTEIKILRSIGFAGHWQDERKQANLIANYWCQKFISVFAKQLGHTRTEIWHLRPAELFAAYRRRRVASAELKRRKRGCLYYTFTNGAEGMVSGRQYERIWKRISDMNVPANATVLRGIGASPGILRGIIRKIETPSKHGKNLRPGEILLTYMTRPDFVPYMHKAGAIVTDEGGLTSHAAIIARELKIPCVVGTRVAMRVLKDGDLVEIDAANGLVRKIR
ncbi:MAG: PEP-utilizing enzyme [Patescibacteria group bacterium]